jgi:hypothetical protein
MKSTRKIEAVFNDIHRSVASAFPTPQAVSTYQADQVFAAGVRVVAELGSPTRDLKLESGEWQATKNVEP